MKYVDVNVRIEIPVNATKVQIENWLFQHFNVTSELLDRDNPLADVDIEAASAYHIEVSDIIED